MRKGKEYRILLNATFDPTCCDKRIECLYFFLLNGTFGPTYCDYTILVPRIFQLRLSGPHVLTCYTQVSLLLCYLIFNVINLRGTHEN